MPRIVDKVIHEPIWSKRALSINVGNNAPDTIMRISCDYRKKDGSLFLPDTYMMPVREIRKYSTQKIKGATLHLIPFSVLNESLKQTNYEQYQPTPTQGKDLRVADNWEAATALEKFKQAYLDPLYKRVQEGWEYVEGDKYEKECQLSGKQSNPAEKKRIEDSFNTLKYKFDQFDKVYCDLLAMVARHEELVDKISEYNAYVQEWFIDGKISSNLNLMQCKLLEAMFKYYSQYLKSINEKGPEGHTATPSQP